MCKNKVIYKVKTSQDECVKSIYLYTPFVLLCLSSIPFWDVPKYCPVSKNKSH